MNKTVTTCFILLSALCTGIAHSYNGIDVKSYAYKGIDNNGKACALALNNEEFRSSLTKLRISEISAAISYGDPNAWDYEYFPMKYLKPGVMTNGEITVYWNGTDSVMDSNVITQYEYKEAGETHICTITSRASFSEFNAIRWPNGKPMDPNDPRL